jgi:hypothetical protein
MVEPEVTAEAGVRLRDQFLVFPLPLFLLQRPPPSLDKNVVQIAPSSAPAHGDARGEKGNILARKRSILGGLGPSSALCGEQWAPAECFRPVRLRITFGKTGRFVVCPE